MLFSTIFTATALLGSALAADHSVMVSNKNGDLSFTPNNLNASKGDTVTFKFWPKNHSIAQAAFAKPCEPMDNGFWSGFISSSNGAATEQFMITVNDATKPIWFYCTQAKHCQSGMVGAINAPATGNTPQKFSDAAKAAANNVSPTSKAGSGGMLMANGAMSSASGGSSSASGSPAKSTGAASTLEVSGMAMSGVFGLLGYLFL